jgi:hypothetical protein
MTLPRNDVDLVDDGVPPGHDLPVAVEGFAG